MFESQAEPRKYFKQGGQHCSHFSGEHTEGSEKGSEYPRVTGTIKGIRDANAKVLRLNVVLFHPLRMHSHSCAKGGAIFHHLPQGGWTATPSSFWFFPFHNDLQLVFTALGIGNLACKLPFIEQCLIPFHTLYNFYQLFYG